MQWKKKYLTSEWIWNCLLNKDTRLHKSSNNEIQCMYTYKHHLVSLNSQEGQLSLKYKFSQSSHPMLGIHIKFIKLIAINNTTDNFWKCDWVKIIPAFQNSAGVKNNVMVCNLSPFNEKFAYMIDMAPEVMNKRWGFQWRS